jgi:hypothetical protein
LGERRAIEAIYGGDNSTYLENTNPDWSAIHTHGGMEHNLAKYAKYCSCGCIEILGSNEFTRETNHNIEEIFLDIGMLKTSYTLNLR